MSLNNQKRLTLIELITAGPRFKYFCSDLHNNGH